MSHTAFARLRDSIRAITHQSPPSAYRQGQREDAQPGPKPTRRVSQESANNEDPNRSGSRLGFVKAFRRSSIDSSRSQSQVPILSKKEQKELDAQRVREERKERERLAKEQKAQEQLLKQEKVKVQRASEQNQQQHSVYPLPLQPFQQPTLSKGSMSSPSLQLHESPAKQRQPNPPLRIRISASASASHLPLDSPPPSPVCRRTVSPPPIPKASANRPTRPLTRHPNTSAPVLPSSPTALRPSRTRTPSPTPQVPRDPELQTLIQFASRTLLKHLLAPKPPDQPMSSSRERQLAEIEARLRSLARLEHRYWRESASPAGPVSAGDDRERRYFVDALRDGYILCAFMNTILPSRTLPLKPSTSNPSSNISRFLTNLQTHFQADPSTEHIPAFLPDDLGPSPTNQPPAQLQAYWDGLKRVANCIIAMGHLRDSQLQSQQAASPNSGPRAGIYQRNGPGSMSTPDLVTGRAQSPVSPTRAKRFNPPSPSKAAQSSLEPNDRGKGRQREKQLEHSSTDEMTNRISVSTNATTATYLSSLFTAPDRNYGTVKTMATDLTSTSGGTSSKVDEVEEIVRRRRRVSEVGIPADLDTVAEAEVEGGGTMEVKVKIVEDGKVKNNEIARKVERRGKVSISPIKVHPGQGKRHGDFIDVFNSSPPVTPKSGSEFVEKSKINDNDVELSDTEEPKPASRSAPIPIPTSLTPRRELNSSPSGSPRRPLRLRRPSAGSPSPGTSALRSHSPSEYSTRDSSPTAFARRVPIPPSSSSTAVHSVSPYGLLSHPQGEFISSSKVAHAQASSLGMEGVTPLPMLSGRRYSANASIPSAPVSQLKTTGKYTPKTRDSKTVQNGYGLPDQLDAPLSGAAVPFPRRSSEEHQRHSHGSHPSVTILPALPSSTETLTSQTLEKSTDSLASQKPHRPPLSRGRFQSEDLAGAETLRIRAARQVEEETASAQQQTRPRGRGRTESMVNLGAEQGVGSMIRDRTGANISGPRLTVTLKENGQQPVHYQLGNCIGKGQFGTVYRALNLNNGQTVAVKRISLVGLSDPEITQLMNEVDLLKRLSHPGIVKYEGMSRDSDTLNIVLEYVENGSLLHTLKAFGRLNERLVASYVIKILEGLHYLHRSQVVHCDLKAANILTTKNGNVKLSDFGVSLNLRAMENIKDNVAGTPNWMAPEIIELKGASPSSDIWSLGCTVVELLTGKPPYADIANAMTVMFRIVDDEKPPLPENCSGPLRDFLLQCFQKNPSLRPSAELLFEHQWLKMSWGIHKDLRPQDSLPFLRRVSAELQRADSSRPYASNGVGRESPDTQNIPLPKRISSDLRTPITSTDSDPPNGTASQHTFVKTHLSKAVLCRVCETAVKGRVVLCQDCSFIAHTRCSENAPADCDLRVQLQLYARFSQDLPSSPAITPTPLEPATPPTPAKMEPSPSPAQMGIHRIFSRKKSKTNYNEFLASSTPPVVTSSKSNVDTSKRTHLFGRTRTNRGESHSRNSMGSEPNSSSLRSQANRHSAILNGLTASPATGSTPLPTPPPKTTELPATANAGPQNAASRFGPTPAPTPTPTTNPGSNNVPRDVKALSPDDQTYIRRRKRLAKTESKSSGCTTQ